MLLWLPLLPVAFPHSFPMHYLHTHIVTPLYYYEASSTNPCTKHTEKHSRHFRRHPFFLYTSRDSTRHDNVCPQNFFSPPDAVADSTVFTMPPRVFSCTKYYFSEDGFRFDDAPNVGRYERPISYRSQLMLTHRQLPPLPLLATTAKLLTPYI